MKIIIVGAGLVGRHIAKELSQENKDIIIIEKNNEIARIVANELDCMSINEDGSRLDVLEKAGIEECDYFIALTGVDEVNMITCGMVASHFKKPKTIARARNPYYKTLLSDLRSFLGIDYIINPEIESAEEIVRSLEEGVAKDVFNVIDDRLQMRILQVKENSPYIGKTIQQIRKELDKEFLIPALSRNNTILIPSGDTKVESFDQLYFLGSPKTLDQIFGIFEKRINLRKIGIIGGGTKIGEFVIDGLRHSIQRSTSGWKAFFPFLAKPSNLSITVLESSKDRAKALCQLFPDITVIHRDVGEEDILEKEEFSHFDVVVSVMESQSLNIINAMFAKQIGVQKTIALVVDSSYLRLSSLVPIDSIISLKSAVVNSILRVVRRGNIQTIHTFYEYDLELLRLTLSPNAKPVGKQIKDLNLPKDALILFITRGDENIVPSGSTVLQPGDLLGFIVKKDVISKLETIFESTDEL
jgi:trk system potassium uptake protein TrkA